MRRAIFLVTTIQGIRKPTFLQQLLTLLNDHYEVAILFAMTNFDEVWQAQREFEMIRNREHLQQGVNVITLGDVYADRSGVRLTDTDYLKVELTALTPYESHAGHDKVVRYVDHDGNIVAETLYGKNQVRLHTILFDKNSRIIQINNYNQQDHLYSIERCSDDLVTESLLLNANSELVFRFSNYVLEQKIHYGVAKTSLIPVPSSLSEISGNKKEDPLTHYETKGESVVTKATSYSDYHRYNDINAFYHQVLLNLNTDSARVYLDIDNVIDASKYLPGKQIFNY